MRGGRFLWRTRWWKTALTFVSLTAICFMIVVCYMQATSSRPISQMLSPLLFSTSKARCYNRRSEVSRRPTNAKQSPIFIDTAEVYPHLDFAPRYDTFWNKTFEERYLQTREKWKDLPLKVIVVPHSHNDPGWLLTFEAYYDKFTSKILDNMVDFLDKTPDFTFVWSEVSLFAKWWEKTSNATRTTVKRLLERQQLEILTGGWVMTDEATSHYYAMIDQLIEGHQWLKTMTGTIPKHGWSIDIFGHSSTMPYLLSSLNITETIILRTHYAWKTFLAETRQLDFYWEHDFDSPRILCHMAPSDLYSFKHTCGPDHKVCLQFDFRQIHNEFSESMATDISNENVKPKAERLLAQYGRYGSLFPHNVLLVPLGDDFRYNYRIEWQQQYENYQRLFQYINNKTELNAHVGFGTVKDYFEEVQRRLNKTPPFTSIRGDFFPYADTYSDGDPAYWTGFYTTRPFWKHLARELQRWLRAAEILFTFCFSAANNIAKAQLHKDYRYLVAARQQLALFQHHDAITGTSKEHVIADYGNRMHGAIRETMGIVSHTSQHFLTPSKPVNSVWTSKVNPETIRPSSQSPPIKLVLSIPPKGRQIILFNSMTQSKREPIRIKVNVPHVTVLDEHGNKILSQINPVWDQWLGISKSVFELVFICNVKPISFTRYTLVNSNASSFHKSEVSLQMAETHGHSVPQNSAFTFTCHNEKGTVLQNSRLRAKFSRSGNLQEIVLVEKKFLQEVQLEFHSYKSAPYHSGGYLFRPLRNEFIPLEKFTNHLTLVRTVRGPVLSEITFIYRDIFSLTTRLYHSEDIPDGLEMEAMFNLSDVTQNMELVMRLNSDIESKGVFYTDSNGFQMTKRRYASAIPVQGNYYPATSAIYVEDDYSRLTVLMSHSHGVTSPGSGNLEIMLDRRLHQDDSRGMGEGVLDNVLTIANFWILPEYLESNAQEDPSLSSAGHTLSEMLLYPVTTLFADSIDQSIPPSVQFMHHPWPSDTHLINLRTLSSKDFNLPSRSALMIIHRKKISCKIRASQEENSDDIIQANAFRNFSVKSLQSVTLGGTVVLENLMEDGVFEVPTGTIKSYKLTYR